jgi:hypothetical protein
MGLRADFDLEKSGSFIKRPFLGTKMGIQIAVSGISEIDLNLSIEITSVH